MQKILLINGPNLGHLGQRDTHIYGTKNMDYVLNEAKKLVALQNETLDFELFQSNHEGVLIDRLELAREEFLTNKIIGIVLNAGAFTHTSLALADSLSWIKVPFVEVHISNILARSSGGASAADSLRGTSLFAQHSLGIISGFGLDSYVLAIQSLMRYNNQR